MSAFQSLQTSHQVVQNTNNITAKKYKISLVATRNCIQCRATNQKIQGGRNNNYDTRNQHS